jgi:hypothetical protein
MSDEAAAHEPTAPKAAHTKLPERERRLLFGLALPPLAWSLHLLVGYGLVYPSARLGSKRWLVVVTVTCLLLALSGALLAGVSGRADPAEPKLGPPGSPPERPRALALPAEHDRTRADRARFLSRAGIVLGIFFACVIAAQTLPIALLRLEPP